MDNVLDLLEKRVAALELQIFPDKNKPIDLKSPNIVDYLLEAQEMITTALSCREAVTNILQKLPLINELLDPNCNLENASEMRQYILDLYPELKKTVLQLKQFFELEPILSAENYVTQDLTERLNTLTISTVDGYNESEKTKDEVKEILKALQDMTYSYKMLFGQLEYSMAIIEESLKPKQVLDD